MMHVAIFDAVNAIERVYTPYHVRMHAAHGASPEAAAAQAGHDILTALFPARQGTFDALLEAQLADLPRGRAMLGRFIGRRAAVEVLEWRQNDGWAAPQPAYVLPPFPGLWQPTPLALSIATFTHLPDVTPFALLTNTQYLPPPPPTLTSERYARDFDEVKRLGSATSTERTEEQTLLSRLIAGVLNPVPLLLTPPYPSYAGNAACLSKAGSRVLELALGTDDVAFSVTWAGTPSYTREFTSLSQFADIQAKSRIWGGIHYQFDTDASQVACAKVAEYVFANFMRPRRD